MSRWWVFPLQFRPLGRRLVVQLFQGRLPVLLGCGLALFLDFTKVGLLYRPAGQLLLFFELRQLSLPAHSITLHLRQGGNLQREQPFLTLNLLALNALVVLLVDEAALHRRELPIEHQGIMELVPLAHRPLDHAFILRGHIYTSSPLHRVSSHRF